MLRALSQSVYASFFGDSLLSEGVRTYLEDVWRDAPRRQALTHILMALTLMVLPLCTFYKFKLFSQLNTDEKLEFLTKLMHSRTYVWRVLVFALKGNALVAHLRDSNVRALLKLRSIPSKAKPSPNSNVEQPCLEADYVIIGSGAAGAAAAYTLCKQNEVAMLERGSWYRQGDFTADLYGAIRGMFQDFGMQAARGRALFPVLQGVCVGGTTVMSGAIMHRLPKPIYTQWLQANRIHEPIAYDELENHAHALEDILGVRANLEATLDELPVSKALKRLGWSHTAMRRNAPGCEASGQCLQGCPSGGKFSMERSLLPGALKQGLKLVTGSQAQKIEFRKRRAIGVWHQNARGKQSFLRARKGILIAAGTIQSPLLLKRSGIRNRALGENLQCHLGVGITGWMDNLVREIEGPPQGIELWNLNSQEIKCATQLLPPELRLARSELLGNALVNLLKQSEQLSCWTGSVRSRGIGRVTKRFGQTRIEFEPTPDDMARCRLAIKSLATLLFEMGAKRVFPQIHGIAAELKTMQDIDQIAGASLDPRHYWLSVGHIFGTCRMGRNRENSVVSGRGQVHDTDNLYCIDASVFPTNIGVNPQLGIMTLARAISSRLA